MHRYEGCPELTTGLDPRPTSHRELSRACLRLAIREAYLHLSWPWRLKYERHSARLADLWISNPENLSLIGVPGSRNCAGFQWPDRRKRNRVPGNKPPRVVSSEFLSSAHAL